MQAVLDLTIPYIHERSQFGRPIGTFELMQGEMLICTLRSNHQEHFAIELQTTVIKIEFQRGTLPLV